MTSLFSLKPADVSSGLVKLINDNPAATKDLLPVTAEQAKIWSNTEKLEPLKRIELQNKLYTDVSFRQKCLNDPEEVLRWGGYRFLIGWKKGWSSSKVFSIPHLDRPNPATYLDDNYILKHLEKFEGGVTKITPSEPFGNIGPPSGTFVLPKKFADELIEKSQGKVEELEKLLGLTPGYLGKKPYRIDVASPSGLRVPNGNELGANEFWLPGGFTSGGVPEATVNQIVEGSYIKSIIF
ncbi:MAG: hypothetical protein H0W50_09310 [Parachlamydiaceae bacterium]|nr:hypothetical protein [Parachlamydiaceae bacterium]